MPLIQVQPPAGSQPSSLQIGPTTYLPTNGTFTIQASELPVALAAGFSAVSVTARAHATVMSGQTIVLSPNTDVNFDKTTALATAKLPASPTVGETHSIKWTVGAIPPVVDGNGNTVEQWSALGTFAATTTITPLYQGGTIYFNGAKWEWR